MSNNKTPLSIVNADDELKALKEDLDKGYEMHLESQEFMKKQVEESWNTLIGTHWGRIEELLKSRNLLPDDYEYGLNHKSTRYSIGFSDGVLFLTDKTKNPDYKNIIDMLFR